MPTLLSPVFPVGGTVMKYRTDGATVQCPTCHAKFGGMDTCPRDGAKLVPLPDADPMTVAFSAAVGEEDS